MEYADYLRFTKIARKEIKQTSDITCLCKSLSFRSLTRDLAYGNAKRGMLYIKGKGISKLTSSGFIPLKALNTTFKSDISNVNILSYFLSDFSQK